MGVPEIGVKYKELLMKTVDVGDNKGSMNIQ